MAPDSQKLDVITALIDQLSQAQSELMNVGRNTEDNTKLIQINNEYMALQSCMDLAVQAQLATDDALFDQATGTLKNQAKVLDDMEQQIKKIISDIALAAKIVGYIAQAIALIAKL